MFNNELIITFSEYDADIDVPVKTINLDKDSELNNKLFPLSPELKLPNINNVNYISGLAYKGWYHIFIRYKINQYDYTKWNHIGFPIFIDKFINFP